MLFNSYAFILGFLPVTFFVFFALARKSHRGAAAWLMLASFFFYGWWSPKYVLLLAFSILFNFATGARIQRLLRAGRPRRAKGALAMGVAVDLLLLGYYKYANFFVDNLNHALGVHWVIGEIILPLGISFYTFTQIAYLADAAQGKVREYNLIHYALFVTYFPHLIAGPILHHAEMMPQFDRPTTYRMRWENVAVGLTIFFIGLFKKTVLADGIAPHSTSVFDAAAAGTALPLLDAWGGALAYTLRLYFDFSGYCDMAIGLSRLFGVNLPLNFNSPYKAANIIDFWRRWHMTLTRFLTAYLYNPLVLWLTRRRMEKDLKMLGGRNSRIGGAYFHLLVGPTLLTMFLSGLWHGANWTFVIWGALHGLYLVVNHAWHALRHRPGLNRKVHRRGGRIAAQALTFLAVVVASVFFRATSIDAALVVLKGMAGLNGIEVPLKWLSGWGAAGEWLGQNGVQFRDSSTFAGAPLLTWILAGLAIVWFAPNTQQIMERFDPALDYRPEPKRAMPWLRWQLTTQWAFATMLLAYFGLLYMSSGFSEFIYFQF
jgi:D-alanyl-lipoteichoic acid acyltransferase DltB (MBOAT superfamily)